MLWRGVGRKFLELMKREDCCHFICCEGWCSGKTNTGTVPVLINKKGWWWEELFSAKITESFVPRGLKPMLASFWLCPWLCLHLQCYWCCEAVRGNWCDVVKLWEGIGALVVGVEEGVVTEELVREMKLSNGGGNRRVVNMVSDEAAELSQRVVIWHGDRYWLMFWVRENWVNLSRPIFVKKGSTNL